MSDNKIVTVWEVWEYDVWGNAKDGYEVNDRYCVNRHLELTIDLQVANVGTEREFTYAEPTLAQIKAHIGVNCSAVLGGDDLHITVDRKSDDKPLAELICISHESLSPVRRLKVS